MQVEAKDIDQGQLAFFRFRYEISKCGSFGHEIIVRFFLFNVEKTHPLNQLQANLSELSKKTLGFY